MNRNAYTLPQVLALRTAAEQAVKALLPVRDAYKYPAEEYNALNRIINAAVELADQAAAQYVDAHILPAPENPAPGFTARLAEVAADLADPAHLNWEEQPLPPADMTGRIYISIAGATWYEIAAEDALNGSEWVTTDVAPDPKGFSTKYEHCAHDCRGYML